MILHPRRVVSWLAGLSPQRRRWLRFLRELPLDPMTLPQPIEEPPDGDFIICGCPRSGTTLLAAQLFQPPRLVTVMEPWDGMRLPPAELFRSLRREIVEQGRLRRGRLDAAALGAEGAVRWQAEGANPVPLEVDEDFRLGVKWPAYWRFLDLLPRTRFVVCLRHPAEVVSSFKRKGGRLGEGLEYDTLFHRAMNQALLLDATHPAERRALLYERINASLLPHLERPEVFPVRYERWFEDPETLQRELQDFLRVELRPWPARLHTATAPTSLEAEDLAALRRHGASARALGYDLDATGATGA